MMTHPSEAERLATLHRYDILDSPPEQTFDDLVHLAAALCDSPMAAISLVDEGRQWCKARVGLAEPELSRSEAFCAHAIAQDAPVFVVPDAREDARFRDWPLVTRPPGVRFYAGAVLTASDGSRLGALCVLDRRPRTLTREQERGLRVLARQVEAQLELRLNLAERQRTLERVRAQHEALERMHREQRELTAFIVHDLKSPLTAVALNVEFAMGRVGPAQGAVSAALEEAADASTRLQSMVESLLQVARLSRPDAPRVREPVALDILLRKTARPFARRAGSHLVALELEVPTGLVVLGDAALLQRAVENLLDNALRHTPHGGRIRVAARNGEALELSVSNTGSPIPPAHTPGLFTMFQQGSPEQNRGSAGLGLSFCRRVAQAHGGDIRHESSEAWPTTFVLSLPRD